MIKLIPIAKPVRFTIKSGGRDCADLEGLRRSFNVDDLNKIEIKQLQEWAKRKCSDVPSIAERLNKKPSELEYYQIFFQQDFKDLHAAWKWLKEFDKYKDSVDFLFQQLIKRGDKQTIEDLFNGKSADDILELLSSHKIDFTSIDIKEHKEFFMDMARDIIDDKPKANTTEFEIITILAKYGIDNAKNYHDKNVITTKDYSHLLIDLLNYEGQLKYLDSYLTKECKVNLRLTELPTNLYNFALAALNSNPVRNRQATFETEGYGFALKMLAKDKHLSDERLFFRMLLEGFLRYKHECYNDKDELLKRSYPFISIYNKNDWSKLPDDMQSFLLMKWDFRYSEDQMSETYFKTFLGCYFKHFLEDKYYHGRLEDL